MDPAETRPRTPEKVMLGRKDRFVLNIRGQRFEVEKSVCKAVPNTRLAELSEGDEEYCKEDGEFFFNRDPVLFNVIVSYYVTGG